MFFMMDLSIRIHLSIPKKIASRMAASGTGFGFTIDNDIFLEINDFDRLI